MKEGDDEMTPIEDDLDYLNTPERRTNQNLGDDMKDSDDLAKTPVQKNINFSYDDPEYYSKKHAEQSAVEKQDVTDAINEHHNPENTDAQGNPEDEKVTRNAPVEGDKDKRNVNDDESYEEPSGDTGNSEEEDTPPSDKKSGLKPRTDEGEDAYII